MKSRLTLIFLQGLPETAPFTLRSKAEEEASNKAGGRRALHKSRLLPRPSRFLHGHSPYGRAARADSVGLQFGQPHTKGRCEYPGQPEAASDCIRTGDVMMNPEEDREEASPWTSCP